MINFKNEKIKNKTKIKNSGTKKNKKKYLKKF